MRARALAVLACAGLLAGTASAQTLEERVQALEASLGGAPKPAASNAAYNPAIGMAIDLAVRNTKADRGHFGFRAAELNVDAPVDPHLKAWAIINGQADAVEVEEAVLQTTSLPYSFTLRGGRMFASFGRLPRVHDHELPFVDRTASLDVFPNGEARGDGLETSWLAPLPFYVNLTLGAYNRLGSENERSNDDPRPWDEFTYLANVKTALEFDDHTIDLGASSAWTPKRSVTEDVAVTGSVNQPVTTRRNTWRALNGVDVTYRWQPAAGGIYRGLTWGTEVFQNTERLFDESTRLPTDRRRAYGGYTYVQLKMGRHWRPGAFADYAQSLTDPRNENTKTFGGFLTYDVTEFQKVRLQYDRQSLREIGRRIESKVALQWSIILGHHVHGFRDR